MDAQEAALHGVLSHCAGLPEARFAPGEILIPEGPSSGLLFILVSGEVEVLRGDVQVADIAEPGAVFGEISALLGAPHTATVRAVTNVVAYRIEDAAEFLKERTEIMFHVGRILARRLTDATVYLADIKRQFADRKDHLAMVDEVLETLVQRQRPAVRAGSSLTDDDRL